MFISGAVYRRLLEDLQTITATAAEDRQRHDTLSGQAADQLAAVREELGTERGRREILSQQTAIQKSLLDFLCSRVNQLEVERVLLLRQITPSLELPAPVMRPIAAGPPVDPLTSLADLSIFDDDPRHAPAGWHQDGTVNYGAAPTGGMTS